MPLGVGIILLPVVSSLLHVFVFTFKKAFSVSDILLRQIPDTESVVVQIAIFGCFPVPQLPQQLTVVVMWRGLSVGKAVLQLLVSLEIVAISSAMLQVGVFLAHLLE